MQAEIWLEFYSQSAWWLTWSNYYYCFPLNLITQKIGQNQLLPSRSRWISPSKFLYWSFSFSLFFSQAFFSSVSPKTFILSLCSSSSSYCFLCKHFWSWQVSVGDIVGWFSYLSSESLPIRVWIFALSIRCASWSLQNSSLSCLFSLARSSFFWLDCSSAPATLLLWILLFRLP